MINTWGVTSAAGAEGGHENSYVGVGEGDVVVGLRQRIGLRRGISALDPRLPY